MCLFSYFTLSNLISQYHLGNTLGFLTSFSGSLAYLLWKFLEEESYLLFPHPSQETDIIRFATFQAQKCSSSSYILGRSPLPTGVERGELIPQWPETASPFRLTFRLLTLLNKYNLLKLIWQWLHTIKRDLTDIQLILSSWAHHRYWMDMSWS
jgi:hypothetical protein